jgi:hypothetical protein
MKQNKKYNEPVFTIDESLVGGVSMNAMHPQEAETELQRIFLEIFEEWDKSH